MVELISILSGSNNSKIVLYKMPANAATMESPGLSLPNLILIPSPTSLPTPTETPVGAPATTP